jgi:hypothetical protein
MKSSGHYLFHEEQSFRQSWIIGLAIASMIGVIIIEVYGMYQQLHLGKPWGDTASSDSELLISSIVTILILCVLMVFLLTLTLVTEVRDTGICYRFPVLINRMHEIKKEDIDHYTVGKYNPILDYGGWGIRIRPWRGKAFNVRGNQGMKIFLKNGKTVLFGTQDPSGLDQAMRKLMN